MNKLGRLSLVNMKVDRSPSTRKTVTIYIGRPSVLQNRWPTPHYGTRSEVCDRYDRWLEKRVTKNNRRIMAELNRIADLIETGTDVVLECYCKPKRCHGDSVLKQVRKILRERSKG